MGWKVVWPIKDGNTLEPMTLLGNKGLNVGWKHKGESGGCVEVVDNIE